MKMAKSSFGKSTNHTVWLEFIDDKNGKPIENPVTLTQVVSVKTDQIAGMISITFLDKSEQIHIYHYPLCSIKRVREIKHIKGDSE